MMGWLLGPVPLANGWLTSATDAEPASIHERQGPAAKALPAVPCNSLISNSLISWRSGFNRAIAASTSSSEQTTTNNVWGLIAELPAAKSVGDALLPATASDLV